MIAFISVDWGTSSFRAAAVDPAGRILDRAETGEGILHVGERGFAGVLQANIGRWTTGLPPVPIIMSGMIGSRQGWVEARYFKTPVTVAMIASGLTWIDGGALGRIAVVPGVETFGTSGVPDVMRGEETQIFGAIAGAGVTDGLFVLPGTHSKWVDVRDGAIASFATYMSGEIFSALTAHTILGRLMPDAPSEDAEGFALGVVAGAAAGHPGDLLNRVFATRTHGLISGWSGERLSNYLSGLLIGAELAAATAQRTQRAPVHVIGSAALTRRYLQAAECLRIDARVMEPDRAVAGHDALLKHLVV